ncbi:MAG: hypothetical protein H6673_08665 [Anaerolineales bacterium]|nr:hypothetical protein [Anaerolineales bacterium]
MTDIFNELSLTSFIEIEDLRTEAQSLYDHSLTEGNPVYFIDFIHRQLASSPPPLFLLRAIADDLQQRLFALREEHFNAREKVVNTFWDIYHLDITPILPPDQLDHYHTVKPKAIIAYVVQHGVDFGSEEQGILIDMINNSHNTAIQLQADIDLTRQMQTLLQDWLVALSAQYARGGWLSQLLNDTADRFIH